MRSYISPSMRRHREVVRRLLAGMLALWFAFVATEGGRAHACAKHDGAMAAAAVDQAASGGHGHGAHGGHAMPVSDASGTHHDGAAPHHCTCPDASCGASVMAIAAPRETTHFAIVVADVRRVFEPSAEHLPTAPRHLQPFANGPPAPALA